jgi:hypothetical protein
MRYYDLTLQDAGGNALMLGDKGFTKSSTGAPTFSSMMTGANGQRINNPAALNIEFDIPVSNYAEPQGQHLIRIWGIGLKQLSQAADLNPTGGTPKTNFVLRAGMSKGLPLAKPEQAGVIAAGQIYQAYGNWQGVEQTLELIAQPGYLAPSSGVSFVWSAGQLLSDALRSTLSLAYPTYKLSINIAPITQSLQSVPVCGWYSKLSTFAGYLTEGLTALGAKVTGKSDYTGVQIAVDPFAATIQVYDSTVPAKTIALDFADLIGQPTWIGPGLIGFKTAIRADITIGNQVTFPKGVLSPFALTSQAAAVPSTPARNSSVFNGTFVISQEIHHFGNFRQPDADSWCTAFVAAPSSAQSAS